MQGKREPPLEMASRIADSLDPHHNEFAQRPPHDTRDVFGVALEPAVLERFAEFGCRSMSAGDGYIRLTKQP